MVCLINKLNPKEDDVVKFHSQVGSITTNLRFKIYFTLSELSAKIVT